jgi:exopolyphosphatase/guanosine-5'-triphosphate,3'-diphosphate pyrophosphatase
MLALQYPVEVPLKRRAVLDLGSNSFHLLVADVAADVAPIPVADLKATVRLGEHALHTGVIDDLAWGRGLEAVDQLAARARSLRAPLAMVGTSVLRDAENGPAFADAVMRKTGCEIAILSGDDEARMSWIGARATLARRGRLAVLDVGGGSVDIAVGDDGKFVMSRSLPLGFLRGHGVATLRERAREATDLVRSLTPTTIAFTGGTARTLTRVIGGEGLDLRVLRGLHQRLVDLDAAGRLALGVPAARVDTIVAGAAIVATLMELLDIRYASVAAGGLREGVLATMA